MRTGWQEKKLGEVLTLEYGKPLPPAARDANGKYAVYGANGIKDRSDRFYFDKPSIIVGRKGSAGEITLIQDKFWPLDVTYFVMFDDSKYDLQFLYYLLSLQELTKLAKGVKPGINRNEVYAKVVRVPPLPEQQRIVAILDEAFAGLATATANVEKNLKNARELFDSYLNSVFQGEGDLVALATLASEITDGDHMPPPKSEEGVPFVTISNINKATNEIDFSDTFKVPEAYYAALKKNRKPLRGDVLYTVTGSFGIPVVVNSKEKFCYQRHIGLVRPKAEVNSKWLYYALRSKLVFDQAASAATGTAQKTVSLKVLRKIQLPQMSQSAQEAATEKLDNVYDVSQQLQAIYRRRIDAVAELKQSILQKAFSGELTASRVHMGIHAIPPHKPSLISIAGISPTDLHAGIIAIAYQKHQGHPKQNTFGHVKAEKISHMVEARVGINLERDPIKDAAGPNDYRHLKKVESRAEKAGFFSLKQSAGGGYTFVRKNRFDELVSKTRKCLGQYNEAVDAVIDELLPMDTQQAEIVATVYAAWNNLLIDGKNVTDEAIVYEARDNWHPDKLKIAPDRFFAAIKWMRTKGLVPTGSGKKVLNRVG